MNGRRWGLDPAERLDQARGHLLSLAASGAFENLDARRRVDVRSVIREVVEALGTLRPFLEGPVRLDRNPAPPTAAEILGGAPGGSDRRTFALDALARLVELANDGGPPSPYRSAEHKAVVEAGIVDTRDADRLDDYGRRIRKLEDAGAAARLDSLEGWRVRMIDRLEGERASVSSRAMDLLERMAGQIQPPQAPPSIDELGRAMRPPAGMDVSPAVFVDQDGVRGIEWRLDDAASSELAAGLYVEVTAAGVELELRNIFEVGMVRTLTDAEAAALVHRILIPALLERPWAERQAWTGEAPDLDDLTAPAGPDALEDNLEEGGGE